MAFELKKTLLLTGAGFTANFGGYLARDMAKRILSHPEVKKFPKLQDLIWSPDFDSNYEKIYTTVLNDSKYNEDEKSAIKVGVEQAYRDMDHVARNYLASGLQKEHINHHGLNQLLGSFAGSNGGERGAIFTLNQDLFLERFNGYRSPMMSQLSQQLQHSGKELESASHINLPKTEEEVREYEAKTMENTNDLFYFKLHGSYGWQSSRKVGSQMIIGGDKEKDIEDEPLLNWYFNFFQKALFRDGVNLLIVGYSFNDQHINNLLKRAVKECDLKFHIISTANERDLRAKLMAEDLRRGCENIFSKPFKDIFPEDQSRTQDYEDIQKIFPPRI